MTYTTHPQTTARLSETGWHVISAILAVIGFVAAAVGAWMAFGPDDGVLTIFGWTWNVADISEAWAPILMIGGGALATLTMGIESTRDWGAENSAWIVWLEAFAALVGVAAIVAGILFLF
ncbi:MAG: hypothetical protein WBM90_04290 [Acidimicrobiia bacterium]